MSLPSRPPLVRTALLLAFVTLAPSSVSAAAGPSEKLQQRIDTLLKRRLKPEALPVDLPNPFQVITGGGSTREGSPEEIGPRSLPTDDVTLKSAPVGGTPGASSAAPSSVDVLSATVARMKFGGTIILKDHIKVVINGVQRQEGDMIPADWNNNVVYLKIVRLLPTHVVLRYGDAEATLKF